MPTPYQFLILGAESNFRPVIEDLFLERTQDLGLDPDAFTIIKSGNFADYKSNAPSVCVYFGGDPANDETQVKSLVNEGCICLFYYNRTFWDLSLVDSRGSAEH